MNQISEHPTWSIIDSTKLQRFMECPRSYFYEYILGWRSETPNIHLEFGQSWHIAMETILQHGYSDDAIELAIAQGTAHYRKFFLDIMDDVHYPKTPGMLAEMLRRYCKRFKDDHSQADVLYTETSGVIAVSSDRVMYFKTDSILRGKNNFYQNKVFSREHKTTKSNSRQWQQQWALKVQTGMYNHVIYSLYGPDEVYGVEINGAIFQKTNPDFVRVAVVKGVTAMNVWLWTINQYLEQIEIETQRLADCSPDDHILKAFPMNSESCTNYFGCSYHDFCTSWHNPLRRCESPPAGMIVSFWDPTEQQTTNKMDLA